MSSELQTLIEQRAQTLTRIENLLRHIHGLLDFLTKETQKLAQEESEGLQKSRQ